MTAAQRSAIDTAVQPADIADMLETSDIGVTVQPYDADTPTQQATQTEMEDGTETAVRSMSPANIKQAIDALASGGGGATVGGNVLTPHENLVIKRVTTNAVDIDANAILARNSTGEGVRLENVDLTVNINTAGANGLDTGSEAASTWYHIWVIYNSGTDTVAGLLSASATSPTMPSGYDYKGYVGAVYNDSSSAFVTFFQRGTDVVSENITVVSGGSATSFSTIDLSDYVPPTATAWKTQAQVRNPSSGDAGIVIAPEGSGTSETYGRCAQFRDQQNNNYYRGTSFECMMTIPQQVVYRVFSDCEANIQTLGWRY